jgi:hypothetical protein
MADLSQHTNYTGAYSGLLDNLYVTIAVAAVCLLGYEIEVHIPRRRGRAGKFRRIPVRLWLAMKGLGKGKEKNGNRKVGRDSSEGLVGEKVEGRDKNLVQERNRLGSRESWEFG